MTRDAFSALPFGLPADFDWHLVRSKRDAERLMFRIPNADRGCAAYALHEHRDAVGTAIAYHGIMQAWDHDPHEVVTAFGSVDEFATAIHNAAPPIKRSRRLTCWRGVVVEHANPAQAALGLSWTRSRDIACWFATEYYGVGDRPGVRSFVFEALVEPITILAFHNGRQEQEVLLDPCTLDFNATITIDGTSIRREELTADALPSADALAIWRKLGARYEARKRLQAPAA
jgi:hypothetical protein